MAAACRCHVVLSGDIPRRFHLCVFFWGGTMCRRLCDGRMEGEERKKVRERSGQESRWVSRRGGHSPLNPAPLLPGPLSHPFTLRHHGRRQQHAARQRTPSPPRVRPGGNTSAVAFRGGTSCGTAAPPTPSHGVRTRHRAVDAECLRRGGHCSGVPSSSFRVDGRLVFVLVLAHKMIDFFVFLRLRTLAVFGAQLWKNPSLLMVDLCFRSILLFSHIVAFLVVFFYVEWCCRRHAEVLGFITDSCICFCFCIWWGLRSLRWSPAWGVLLGHSSLFVRTEGEGRYPCVVIALEGVSFSTLTRSHSRAPFLFALFSIFPEMLLWLCLQRDMRGVMHTLETEAAG
ncbi:hypothetical protein MOQ_001514, partial [Trypanosoma cruzi marinkellei]